MSDVRAKHNHYHKPVKGLEFIDVYRVLLLFAVTDPCIQHAVKKLLVAGGRGAGKDVSKDIQEAIDSLVRWQEMRAEEQPRTLVVERVGAPPLVLDAEQRVVDAVAPLLQDAQNRLFDMLLGDDGQAWKEAERYLERTRPDLHERLKQFHSDRNA